MLEKERTITLIPLTQEDREQFILDNQKAFLYGATQEFGMRDDHFEEDGEIISRKTIEASIDGENAEAYRIMLVEKKAGGVVVRIEGTHGDLELLFVSPEEHSKGIGFKAWCLVEDLHPEVRVWETLTPCFELRNVHFYVNMCGFHIVEYYNAYHPFSDGSDLQVSDSEHDMNGMFRFEKIMKEGMVIENSGDRR